MGVVEARRVSPLSSDHCRARSGIATDDAILAPQSIKSYAVRFTRKFAHAFLVIARPCGFNLYVHLAVDLESPVDVFDSGTACFGAIAVAKPSIFYYDATCLLTPTLCSPAGKHNWRLPESDRTLFVVPPLHEKSHKTTDIFCRTTAMSSLYPWLFRPDGSYMFNGSKCEQIFSRLNRLQSTLRNMRRSRAELLYFLAVEESNLRLVNVDRASGKRIHLPTGARRDGPRRKKLRMTGQR